MDHLPPQETFAVIQDDNSHVQRQRISYPGSTKFASEKTPHNSGMEVDQSSVVDPKYGRNEKSGRKNLSKSPERSSTGEIPLRSSTDKVDATHNSLTRKHSPALTYTQSNSHYSTSKLVQSSEVLNLTIREHELENASLSTIEKAAEQQEKVKIQGTQAGKHAPPHKRKNSDGIGVKPAISVSSIPQTRDPLIVKRTRSSTDVTNPGFVKLTAKQHPRVWPRVSAPERVAATSTRPGGRTTHQRLVSESSSVSSTSSGGSDNRNVLSSESSRSSHVGQIQGERKSQQRSSRTGDGFLLPKSTIQPQISSSSLQSGVQHSGLWCSTSLHSISSIGLYFGLGENARYHNLDNINTCWCHDVF